MQMNQNKWTKFGVFIIVLIIIGFVLRYFYINNPMDGEGRFLRCPSNLIFGIYCPGCGTQRALHHLLHLEIKEALRYNALFVFVFPMMIYGMILIGYNVIFNTKKTIPFITQRNVIIGLLLLILIFGIVRNIPYYPFNILMP